MSQLKEILRDILFDKNGHIEVYNLADACINWPNAIEPENLDGEEWFEEPQDLENYDIVYITDEEIEISCGGDWQEPMTIRIECFNGILTVTSAEADEGPDFGLDEIEIKEILKII